MQQLLHLVDYPLVARQQIHLIAAYIVEEVGLQCLSTHLHSTLFAPHLPEHSGFQGDGFLVVGTVNQSAVQFVEGIVEPTLCHRYLCCLEISGIGPCLAPCCLPEQFISLIRLSLVFQCKGEVVYRLTVVWIGITLGDELHRLAQIILGACIASLADVPEAEGIQTAHVVGISAQGLFIIIHRTPGGMSILFQVLPCQEQLFVGFYLLGQQGSLGAVWNRTYLIALGVPLHHHSLRAIEGFQYF